MSTTALRATLPRLVAYVVVAVLGMGTTAVVLRALGTESAGLYFAVLSVGWVTFSVSDFSLSTVAVREASLADDEAVQRDTLRHILGFRIAGWTIAWWSVVAVLGGRHGLSLGAAVTAYLWLLLTIVTNTLSVPLQSRMRQGLLAILLVVQAGLALATAGLLAWVSAPMWSYIGVQVPGLALSVHVLLRREPGSSLLRPRFSPARMVRLAGENWMLGASTVAALVANRLAPVITLEQAGARQAGLYGAAFRIVDSVEAVAALLMSVLLPMLARSGARDDTGAAQAMRRVAGPMILLGTAAGFAMAEWGPDLLPLLAGDAFADLEEVFLPLSLFLVAAFAVQPLNYTLVATRRYLTLFAGCLCGAVVLLLAGATWSESTGAEGAAWATASGYGAILVVSGLGAGRLGQPRHLAWLALRAGACVAATFATLWLPVTPWLRTLIAAMVLLVAAVGLRLADASLMRAVSSLLTGRRPA